MIGLDTNVLVRYFAQDDATQAATVTRLFETTLTEQRPGDVSLVVLTELVWVLSSRYRASRGEIVTVVEALLTEPRLRVQDEAAVWVAVDEFENDAVDFADALIAALNRDHGCEHTVTFDRQASRLPGMKLLA